MLDQIKLDSSGHFLFTIKMFDLNANKNFASALHTDTKNVVEGLMEFPSDVIFTHVFVTTTYSYKHEVW